MKDKERIFKAYETILNEELVPAMGCTEPIALAYCAAKARSVLGKRPERVLAQVSGNIIKNVKSVIVPNTNGAKGIEAAVAIGIVAGREDRLLEVLSEISDAQKEEFREYLRSTPIQVSQQKDGALLDMSVSVWSGSSCASVRIAGEHTNIVRITKDDEILLERVLESGMDTEREERYGLLNVEDIYCFATEAELSQVEGVLRRQIEYNRAAAEEGLRGDYGANIGSVLLMSGEENVRIRAKAMAAAGSDARMNGSELPVVINSGSGNQGLTVSLPVMEYARSWEPVKKSCTGPLRLSNLIAIPSKEGNRPPLGLLRGGKRRRCGGCGDSLSEGRGL